MADNYTSTNINYIDPLTPDDSESISVVGKAIRQVKGFIRSDEQGGLKAFITDLIEEKFIENLKRIYPVGSIYVSLDSSFYPQTVFGGEWEKLPEERFLLNSAGYAGELGGWAGDDEVLGSIPFLRKINNKFVLNKGAYFQDYDLTNVDENYNSKQEGLYSTSSIYTLSSEVKSTEALPPYIRCFMWKRIA